MASPRRRRSTRWASPWPNQVDRVLLVDLDPQACLTYSTGLDPSSLPESLIDVFARTMKAADVRYVVAGIDGLDILPATIDLASTEVHLLTRTAREHVLRRALKGLHDEYDLMLIDCPPSLGILAINGLLRGGRGGHSPPVRDPVQPGGGPAVGDDRRCEAVRQRRSQRYGGSSTPSTTNGRATAGSCWPR